MKDGEGRATASNDAEDLLGKLSRNSNAGKALQQSRKHCLSLRKWKSLETGFLEQDGAHVVDKSPRPTTPRVVTAS
eukprot:CAMPEP_0184494910 /NCGR_PEP_ID=MMETSP0113_2-20130426/29926_1 /TAXON_ID=91329 /ORGANISM="Norrisiella sphaerica, Strain BC52" /LENGTH=75 /DNA_ID=CAMNT_0026880869 /DNA_START=310 /DNA_END=533 /DNA_ORIENTATION=+